MDITKFEVEDDDGFQSIAGELVRWTKKLGKLNVPEAGIVQTGLARNEVEHVQRKTG